MSDNSFFAKSKQLEKMVGKGNLTGIFAVDGGARTVPLEVGGWKTGPNAGRTMENWTTEGTGPHAAQHSFEAVWEQSLKDIADTTLKTGPQRAMESHVERVNNVFQQIAPKDTGQYRESTARVVEDNGMPIYDQRGPSFEVEPSS
jgi:hypothetical protein